MSHESGYVWIIETAWTSHINQQIGSDMFQQFLHMRFLLWIDKRIKPRSLAVSDCWDKGSQKALCAADISATRTNAHMSMAPSSAPLFHVLPMFLCPT